VFIEPPKYPVKMCDFYSHSPVDEDAEQHDETEHDTDTDTNNDSHQ